MRFLILFWYCFFLLIIRIDSFIPINSTFENLTWSPTDEFLDPTRRKLDLGMSVIAPYQGLSLVGPSPSYFGYAIDAGGDINGDGWEDYLIGAHAYNGNNGITYLYYGGTSNSVYFYGEAGTFSGISVAFTGDVNKDGNEDFIIGAHGGVGKAYLIFGKPTMNNINLATLGKGGVSFLGVATSDYTGFCVAGGGDINGDTYPDLLVGAYGATSLNGKLYVIFGRSNMANLTLSTLAAPYGYVINGLAFGYIGYTANFIGDVNNDGYDDFITGAHGYNSAQGAVYLIFGGNGWGGVNIAAPFWGQTIYGWATSLCFGVQTQPAGDVNKDGIVDFLIGSHCYNANQGLAYLIYGHANPFPTINLASLGSNGVLFVGGAAGEIAGIDVHGAGDVNGDGFADILIGAAYYNSYQGRVYLIFGSSSLPSSINLGALGTYGTTFYGPTGGGAQLGWRVRSADINHDGKSDILIGAHAYNTNYGATYIIYGAVSGYFLSAYPTGQPSSSPTNPSSQPTRQPSSQPTSRPSGQPTRQPTSRPSSQPSRDPTSQPSRIPSSQPSSDPSSQPTRKPSSQPTARPSSQPSRQPTSQPSCQPSRIPSGQPTSQPSSRPTSQPSSQPSSRPSSQPSLHPSSQPTRQPSSQPSSQPSRNPTSQPTTQPTVHPSGQPTTHPSCQPTTQPSVQPSTQPTSQPTTHPSSQPSGKPTAQPSIQPTAQPTVQPTRQPTLQPSSRPSAQPAAQPTSQPTSHPSSQPTSKPTCQPTTEPTTQPIAHPTTQPSSQPSSQPSHRPSSQPTRRPSSQPSEHPSSQPSGRPSSQPSVRPSSQPSCKPSSQPTRKPSNQPSCFPSVQPSAQPTSPPSNQPSSRPSNQPTSPPTSQPSTIPSSQPSSIPSSQPSRSPSAQPSMQPSSQPTGVPTIQPSSFPSTQPTSQPSELPSAQPSLVPTTQPSSRPSSFPTSQPSTQPTRQPSGFPSSQPTSLPSAYPSSQPSSFPSGQPSATPSSQPSSYPTTQPSSLPTASPSDRPSSQPTSFPSNQPSTNPTAQPTCFPSAAPSSFPSSIPTDQPSSQPSSCPSSQPSVKPSKQPSTVPSCQPTTHPSSQPSAHPSTVPSGQPSWYPTSQPSIKPSRAPSSQPSSQPTSSPSQQPVGLPSGQPSMQPSAVPTSQPSGQPSISPSSIPSSFPSDSPFSFPTSQPSSKPTLMDAIHFNASLTVLPARANLKMSLFFFGALYGEDGCMFSDVDANVGEGEGVGDNYVLLGSRDWRPGNVTRDIILPNISSSSLVLPTDDKIIRFPGAIVYEQCGRSLAMVDYNGDSRMDVIVGNPIQSEAYLLLGQSKGFFEMNSGLYMLGESKGDYFGFAVSGAGDFNGDGLEDVIVSAILRNRCYVILGKGNILRNVYMSRLRGSVEGFVIEGSSQNSYSGVSVSSAGDMNGDGLSEVVLSALGRSQENVIYVVYGRRDVSGTVWLDSLSRGRGLQIVSRSLGYAGYSLSGAGDVNGDGYDEIIIGSLPNRQGVTSQESYVLYGGVGYGVKEGVNESVWMSVIQLEEIGERGLGLKISGGGLVVSGIGDIDGDGLGDVMVTRYEGWQGKSAAMLLRYPEMLIPTSYPTSSPSLSVTVGGSRGHKATQHPTKSPSLRPSFRPSLAPFSRSPSISPAPSVSAAPSSSTSSPSPTRQLPSAIPFISQAPTYSGSMTGSEATCVVMVRRGGRYDGCDDPVNVFKVMSNESVELSGRGRVNRYEIWGSANMTVWLLNFSLDWDVLDLSAIKGVGGFEDLSYGLDPLMLYLPEGQRIEMSGMDEFELTSENVLFGSDKGKGGGGGSGKVELDLSSLSSSLSPLATPQVVGALGMMLFFMALTCVCSRLESPNLKEMKVKADKRRVWREEERNAVENKDLPAGGSVLSGDSSSSQGYYSDVPDEDVFVPVPEIVHRSSDSDYSSRSSSSDYNSASEHLNTSSRSSVSSSFSSYSNSTRYNSSHSSSVSSHSFDSF